MLRPGVLVALSLSAFVVFFAPASTASAGSCVQGLTANSNADGSITLNWTPNENATAYQVSVRHAGGEWFPISPPVPPSSTTYTYFDTTPGSIHEFGVAVLQGGSNVTVVYCTVSAPSLMAPEGTPPCPTGVRATAQYDHVHIDWDDMAGVDGYNLFVKVGDAGWDFGGHVTASEARAALPQSSEVHRYRVTATRGELQSVDCGDVGFAAQPEIPFFASGWALALATMGSLVSAFVVMRHR